MSKGSGARDPYRDKPFDEVPPGSFPPPGDADRPASWRPPAPRKEEGAASSKRAVIVSRPAEAPRVHSLAGLGFETAMVYGDAAGEHRMMERGPDLMGSAVTIAFVAEALMFGSVPAFGMALVFKIAGLHSLGSLALLVAMAFATGAAPAALVFRDRWYCTEAFTSRYAITGWPRLSLVYAPVIALVYANWRGVKKLLGR